MLRFVCNIAKASVRDGRNSFFENKTEIIKLFALVSFSSLTKTSTLLLLCCKLLNVMQKLDIIVVQGK